ncbi:aminodeoxychorismate lyase [Bacillus smithii]|uniref:aminodeoxychorismate lyase n=1 Tax=Bacillus smithii TaxID=1479 RepID=UPI0030C91448
MIVYLNGQFIEKEKAMISPFDHGYLYGLGVFETIPTYSGHPFLLDDHLERLNEGLKELRIRASMTRKKALDIIQELCRRNGLTDSSVRLNVSAGLGEMGMQNEPYHRPTIFVFQRPFKRLHAMKEKEAVLLTLPRNTPETGKRLKSHHFLNNVAAKWEMGSNGEQEGIFLTKDGHLAEGIVSNLFWVKEGTIFTPCLQTGILDGVTRRFIMKLAERLHIPVQEGYFFPEELDYAEEIFLTNSIIEIAPVRKIGDRFYPGIRGKYVRTLWEEYQRYCSYLWSAKALSV